MKNLLYIALSCLIASSAVNAAPSSLNTSNSGDMRKHTKLKDEQCFFNYYYCVPTDGNLNNITLGECPSSQVGTTYHDAECCTGSASGGGYEWWIYAGSGGNDQLIALSGVQSVPVSCPNPNP